MLKNKFLASAAIALLLAVNNIYAEKINFEFIPFGSTGPATAEIPVEWNPEWLTKQSSFTYSHDIARIACVLANTAYTPASSSDKENTIINAYKKLGADKDSILLNYDIDYEAPIWGNDQSAFSIAHTDSILFITIRGTPLSANEWISNLNISDDTSDETSLHEGFLKATILVQDAMEQYIKKEKLDTKKIRVLITGHSRGAAITNLLAAKLAVENAFPTDHIFAYTFAAPNVTTAYNVSSSEFDFIWNIVSAEDIVPTVPPHRNEWQFTKYGHILVLANSWNMDSDVYEDDFIPRINSCFSQIMGRNYYPFKTGSFIPTQLSMILTTLNKNVGTYYNSLAGIHNKGNRILKKTDISAFVQKDESTEEDSIMNKIVEFLNERTGGLSNYAMLAVNDMHTCETYFSYLYTLSQEEAFSTLGSSQIIIKGSPSGFVQDKDENILLKFEEGKVKYTSIKLPVAARDVGLNRISIGFPANQDFKIVLTDTSLLPTETDAIVEHYDASGVLIRSYKAQKFFADRFKLYVIDAGATTLENEVMTAQTVRGKEKKNITDKSELMTDLTKRIASETSINTEGYITQGFHFGNNSTYVSLLVSSGLFKRGKMMDIQTGLGKQVKINRLVAFNCESLFKFTTFFDTPANDEKFNIVPSLRPSISIIPWHKLKIFTAVALDFNIKNFNDYAFSPDIRYNNMSEYSIGNDVKVVPSLQFGIKF